MNEAKHESYKGIYYIQIPYRFSINIIGVDIDGVESNRIYYIQFSYRFSINFQIVYRNVRLSENLIDADNTVALEVAIDLGTPSVIDPLRH